MVKVAKSHPWPTLTAHILACLRAIEGESREIYEDLMGQKVRFKTIKVNGIASREGVITDVIVASDRVSVGVQPLRLDGKAGYLDPVWCSFNDVEGVGWDPAAPTTMDGL